MQKVPDVLILVLVNQQMDNVSYVYSRIVKRDAVETQLGSLLQETGWTANNIRVEDMKAGGSPSTTVEFTTLGTVNVSSGTLPLEPIIKAFKDARYIELQFMIVMPFKFKGLQEFENKYVKISLRRGTNTYGYSIFVKDPNFKTLNLPLVQPSKAPASRPTDGRSARILALVLIIVLGFFVAMLAYMITKRATGSHSQS